MKFALFPFKANNLYFIYDGFRRIPVWLPCISQLCVHINTISDKELKQLIFFIEKTISILNLNTLKVKNNFLTLFDRKFISIFFKVL